VKTKNCSGVVLTQN